MTQTWLEKWRHRISGAWDVLTGRAWAGYGNPLGEWLEHWEIRTKTTRKPQDERL